MRRLTSRGLAPASKVVGALALVAGLPLGAAAAAMPAAAATPAVVSYPVTFSVVNTDQASALAGLSAPPLVTGDAKTYQVPGHITAPVGALDLPNRAAALYFAGHGYGEWYWHLSQVPAFDYASNQARSGLISVTVDKIGYGVNKPDGLKVGYGTEATEQHEIMQELRSGNYSISGHAAEPFSRLALVGGSQSAFSSEEETAAYKDANGVVLAGFADEGFSDTLLTGYSGNVATCQAEALTDQPANGYPPNYAYRQTTAAQFNTNNLGDTDTSAAVTSVADTLHSEDPCGYPTYSVGEALGTNNLDGFLDKVPLLSVMGDHDSEFDSAGVITPQVALTYQQDVEFAGDPDHTTALVPNTPQALTLSNTAPTFDAIMASWLCARSFGAYSGSCVVPAAATTTAAAAATPTQAASVSQTGASTGSATSLPVTGDDTTREAAAAATLLLLGGIVVGLSRLRSIRVGGRRS